MLIPDSKPTDNSIEVYTQTSVYLLEKDQVRGGYRLTKKSLNPGATSGVPVGASAWSQKIPWVFNRNMLAIQSEDTWMNTSPLLNLEGVKAWLQANS